MWSLWGRCMGVAQGCEGLQGGCAEVRGDCGERHQVKGGRELQGGLGVKALAVIARMQEHD